MVTVEKMRINFVARSRSWTSHPNKCEARPLTEFNTALGQNRKNESCYIWNGELNKSCRSDKPLEPFFGLFHK